MLLEGSVGDMISVKDMISQGIIKYIGMDVTLQSDIKKTNGTLSEDKKTAHWEFNGSKDLMKAAVPALHIYFFGFIFMTLQFSGQATFVALGKAKQATFFSIFRKIIIVVPLAMFLPYVGNLGVNGVFLS